MHSFTENIFERDYSLNYKIHFESKNMKYEDGKQVLLGDKVHLDGGITGTVMCSIDDGIYTSEYLESQWEYLKKGVMVFSEQAGLIHYAEWNEDCMLIERSKK